MLIVVSMLSVRNVFYRPEERMEEADAAREKISMYLKVIVRCFQSMEVSQVGIKF